MTGDRPLTDHEKRLFLSHDGSMDALFIVRDTMLEEGEPTLHDVAIIELLARVESQTNVIVRQGREIVALESQISMFVDMMKGFEELVKRRGK